MMNKNNNCMTQFKDLNEFLAKHVVNKSSLTTQIVTHTRIASKDLNIYGGAYVIPKEELAEFHALYYNSVFVNNRKEYLTEKQMEHGAQIAVDFDFRYTYETDTRQHTPEHIQDMIILYLEELKEHMTFEENKPFDIFIFEKPRVNRLEDKSLTKDGIHMVIGLQADFTLQTMIREKMLPKLEEIWDLPIINTWDAVLDEGISKGVTNWQMYGSRKPGNDAYEMTQHFVINYDKSDGEFSMNELKVADFDMKSNFTRLSVQNDLCPKFEMNPKILAQYNSKLANKQARIKKPASKTRVNLLVDDENDSDDIELSDILDKATLERAMDAVLSKLKPDEYTVKETHLYTQVLPAKYYEPGSHLLNRQVAFALKHTDERLFLSWIMLRSKSSDFDYKTIPTLYHDWCKYFNNSKDHIVTNRSIMYWAKQDAPEEYQTVKSSSIDHFIEETLSSQAEYDYAQVLKHMYHDKYVCVSFANKGVWYVFKNHRWEQDKGFTIRLAISTEMHALYSSKREKLQCEYDTYDANDIRATEIKDRITKISNAAAKLKKTNDKNNIMREAMESFFDKDFVRNMDTNRYLLCFNNGVVDFKNKVFRHGYPQDYITKTTGINYVEFSAENNDISKGSAEIITFMEKLFPIPDLNRYMWDHLASCLIGTNKNQTFNVYHGSGSNGKSILADLMSYTLGEYKGTVPITLVTEKRNGIGGTSSEVIQLKGIRYAVMQEPSKGVKLNEGVMKELTGGDPLQARALYSESEIFEPQFSLVVCTNNLFDIDSNDDGTWRRIRKVDFVSKFIDSGEKHTDTTQYVFDKDKSLKEKLPLFAPIFASMLVKRAFATDGVVEDCEYVLSASNKYRNGQDHIAAFIAENVEKSENPKDRIKKNELGNQFKFWFQQEQGNRKMPKGQELYDYMDKKYGCHTSTGWANVKIKYPDEANEIENLEA